MRALVFVALGAVAACGTPEEAGRSATSGCLFWSADCTELGEPLTMPITAPAPPPPAQEQPVRPPTLPITREGELPAEDLGRVRARHDPYARDRSAEAAFDARFRGETLSEPAETVFPLPANCSSPPRSLLRNSPADRFAPGRNSAASGIYARAYDRCRSPSTWPRP